MKGLDHGFAHVQVGAGRHQGRGLALRHFLGKAGAAEHTGLQRRRHLGLHLVAQQAKGVVPLGLKALAQPDHRHAAGTQLGQHVAQIGDIVVGQFRRQVLAFGLDDRQGNWFCAGG